MRLSPQYWPKVALGAAAKIKVKKEDFFSQIRETIFSQKKEKKTVLGDGKDFQTAKKLTQMNSQSAPS